MVSIICAVMNREEMLRISLPSWLNCKEVGEVILVDWSSNTDLSWVTYDNRVKYVRVFGEDYFNISQAFNIAMDMISFEYTLKLDVDVIINPFFNFFGKYLPSSTEFYNGLWCPDNKIRHEYCSYLIGSFFIQTKNLEKFNTINENYGNEDLTLYKSFISKGLTQRFYEDDFHLIHTPHPVTKRSENYRIKDIAVSPLWNRRMLARAERIGETPPSTEYTIKKIQDIYVARRA
jgi:glycosyltransferase involved in cell wall biosynthesis